MDNPTPPRDPLSSASAIEAIAHNSVPNREDHGRWCGRRYADGGEVF